MPKTEPNETFIGEGVEFITLAGRRWPIPKLGPRQNRIVVPTLNKMYRMMMAEGGANVLASLTTETFDLLSDAVWTALTKAHPKLTKDEFLDWDTDTMELVTAIGIISKQTGIPQSEKKGVTQGEVTAESQSTGTG